MILRSVGAMLLVQDSSLEGQQLVVQNLAVDVMVSDNHKVFEVAYNHLLDRNWYTNCGKEGRYRAWHHYMDLVSFQPDELTFRQVWHLQPEAAQASEYLLQTVFSHRQRRWQRSEIREDA